MIQPTPILRRSWPQQEAGTPPRDRLQTFQRLFLVFAVLALLGIAVALDFAPTETVAQRARSVLCALLVAAGWVVGHQRRRFAILWLVPEAVLLVGFTMYAGDPIASLPAYYIGIQFRALYGTRREVWLLTFAYGFAFLTGLALSRGLAVVTPVILVEVLALGFFTYLLHTLAEVLDRDRQRATELRRSEDRYRVLFESNPWPMWVFDPKSLQILDVNEAAIKQYGYTRPEYLAMTIRDLRVPEDFGEFDGLRPEVDSDKRMTLQVRHRKKDGTIIDVEITGDVIDVDGRRARIGIGVDVTERERAERALRESEQRFRSVAENLREALLITDMQDTIILANSRVRDVLGYEPDDVLGKNATELLLPETQRHVFRDRLLRRLGGDSELYETELVRKDGTLIHAEVSAGPYRDTSGRVIGTLGAISDVTERKRLEDRLRQGMRLEAVGQLAGGVAHDFNNLLTVIKCHTELLLGELRKDDPTRESIGEIARSASRGATLTQQLLAFGRKQLLQPRRVALAEVVAQSAPMLRRLVGKNVLLVTINDDSAAHVSADLLQLEHVLTTLVRNANDAMPKGGRITLETKTLELDDQHPFAATQEMPSGRYAMLSVSDTGVGMDPEVQARVFEPFFTTKELGAGTGLGLASLYGIVRQSGGFVDVESAPNVGTTFRIYLPLAPVAQKAPAPEPQPA